MKEIAMYVMMALVTVFVMIGFFTMVFCACMFWLNRGENHEDVEQTDQIRKSA